MKKDIYIIKNSINNKVYIGQSKNAAQRWLSHIHDARYEKKTNKNISILHRAMMKYGIDKFHYEILEYQIDNYNEKEKYWIKYYDSLVPNGYNIASGGEGCGMGLENVNSIFKDENQLLSCISEISSSRKSFTNIAKKYNCSQEVISAINSGQRYKMKQFVYPLRNTDTKYSYELIKQIRYSLKYEQDLSMKDISKKFNIDLSQISKINQGHIYYVKNEKYPLRSKRKTDLAQDVLKQITTDIIESNLCLADIASKYNVSRTIITGINKGTNYKRKNLIYPLRKENDSRNISLKKYLDRDVIKEIINLLKGDLSVKQIAKKYNISTATIYNINSGKNKKYIIPEVKYPIRNFK